jgi:hypothetical protein
MQNLAPIALFVFNRPEHTRRTIKFLRQNLLANETRLFIFSDGAEDQRDFAKVNEVREQIFRTEGFKSVEIIERPRNFGLANSIITGVSRLVNEYGKVIVIEDDLITSPHTLQYFNDALTAFEKEERVMHIGAYMYPIDYSGLPETFFFRAATSWGWATWKRAWKDFEPDIDVLMADFDQQKKNVFSIDGTMNYWKQMTDFKSGKNNSWAIRWYASMFLKGGLSINPSQSLVNNIGHDGTGVHSGTTEIFTVAIQHKPVRYFPTEISENPYAYEALKNYFKNRKGSIWARIARYLNQRTPRWTK